MNTENTDQKGRQFSHQRRTSSDESRTRPLPSVPAKSCLSSIPPFFSNLCFLFIHLSLLLLLHPLLRASAGYVGVGAAREDRLPVGRVGDGVCRSVVDLERRRLPERGHVPDAVDVVVADGHQCLTVRGETQAA